MLGGGASIFLAVYLCCTNAYVRGRPPIVGGQFQEAVHPTPKNDHNLLDSQSDNVFKAVVIGALET